MGVKNLRLKGGYKAYRRYVVKYLNEELNLNCIVLHGLTGVGKTEVIKQLKKLDIKAVDLEGLANHRGSVFGHVGKGIQPSQKYFETLLFSELIDLESPDEVVVECESKRIGRCYIPDLFYRSMIAGRAILLYAPLEQRIERIIKDYMSETNWEALVEPVKCLKRRLGKEKVNQLIHDLKGHNFSRVVKTLLLEYYDPLYNYPDGPSPAYEFCVKVNDPLQAAVEIKNYLER